MKKIIFTLSLTFICFNLFSAFENQIYSSKQASFSGAGVSCKGQTFVFINPGSSSFSKNKKISFGYSSLLQGFEEELTKNNFLFSYPLKKFHFSFAFDILNLKDIYRESIYLLNFSKNGYGLNLKILSNKYLWNDEYLERDEVLSKREKKGVTIDFGLIKSFKNLNYGFSLLNILPVDIGRKQKDLIPATLKAGFKLKKKNFFKIYETNFLFEVEYKNVSYSEGKFNWSFAIDILPYFKNFSIQAGYSKNYSSAGFSFQKFLPKNFSSSISIDYAYLIPLKMRNFPSHYLNLSFKW